MKKYILLAMLTAMVMPGCSAVVTKNFKVFADPPDSTIRVVSGVELKEMTFRSPASITAEVPKGPVRSRKAVLEVSRENYETKTIALKDINDGDTHNIKLKRVLRDSMRYKLSYKLVSPAVSSKLQFKDKNIAVSFKVEEKEFQMHFTNLSSYDMKILWERAEYTDVRRTTQRLMHSGIRFSDRNNPIPDQIVLSGSSIQGGVIPIKNVYILPQRRGYDIHPLFKVESGKAADLKGKSIILFIPVEINRQIIPYNFKIKITDAVQENVKG
jgi:hypothetical protein